MHVTSKQIELEGQAKSGQVLNSLKNLINRGSIRLEATCIRRQMLFAGRGRFFRKIALPGEQSIQFLKECGSLADPLPSPCLSL